MKTSNWLGKSVPAIAALLGGVLVLATGCVEEHSYVRTYPVPVQPPEPPPTPPVVQLPPTPPPAPVIPIRSAIELERMLAPIALYPDPLLAQILPAATLPEQVVMADRYLREGGSIYQVDVQPWDYSLKALARYPATLRMLDDNLAWTTDLGQAFLNQPADVMDAVQRLRVQARALGNLVSTPQQTVIVVNGVIEIVPATPQIIYVPVYQPEVVYVRPPPAPDRFYISFGAGFAIGAWLNHDCDWHAREVIVWHHDHPRPNDWWYRPPQQRERPIVVNNVVNNVTVINNTTIVNNNVTVWHPGPRNGAVQRGDRGWGQPEVRNVSLVQDAPRHNENDSRKGEHAAPPSREVHPGQAEGNRPPVEHHEPRVTPREEVKPTPPETHAVEPRNETPAPRLTPPARPAERPNVNRNAVARETTPAPRPNQAVTAPKDTRPSIPAPVAKRESPAAPVTRPAATPRPATGALAGIESSRVTREASVRGQQSLQAASRSAAPAARQQKAAPGPKGNQAEPKKQKNGREN